MPSCPLNILPLPDGVGGWAFSDSGNQTKLAASVCTAPGQVRSQGGSIHARPQGLDDAAALVAEDGGQGHGNDLLRATSSVWQTPQAAIFTRASSRRGSASSRVSMRKSSPGFSIKAARIFIVLTSLSNRVKGLPADVHASEWQRKSAWRPSPAPDRGLHSRKTPVR